MAPAATPAATRSGQSIAEGSKQRRKALIAASQLGLGIRICQECIDAGICHARVERGAGTCERVFGRAWGVSEEVGALDMGGRRELGTPHVRSGSPDTKG